MKVTYTTKNNQLKIDVNTESVKDTFKQLAEIQEVFDEPCCGMCKDTKIRFIVRSVENNDYYELKCTSCGAKLAFGQHRNGNSLFPKRKLADGTFDKINKGWHKWAPKEN
jgi:hypothetical protein